MSLASGFGGGLMRAFNEATRPREDKDWARTAIGGIVRREYPRNARAYWDAQNREKELGLSPTKEHRAFNDRIRTMKDEKRPMREIIAEARKHRKPLKSYFKTYEHRLSTSKEAARS